MFVLQYLIDCMFCLPHHGFFLLVFGQDDIFLARSGRRLSVLATVVALMVKPSHKFMKYLSVASIVCGSVG